MTTDAPLKADAQRGSVHARQCAYITVHSTECMHPCKRMYHAPTVPCVSFVEGKANTEVSPQRVRFLTIRMLLNL